MLRTIKAKYLHLSTKGEKNILLLVIIYPLTPLQFFSFYIQSPTNRAFQPFITFSFLSPLSPCFYWKPSIDGALQHFFTFRHFLKIDSFQLFFFFFHKKSPFLGGLFKNIFKVLHGFHFSIFLLNELGRKKTCHYFQP